MSGIHSAYIGGYWFPFEAVNHLLVKAYGIHTNVDSLWKAEKYFYARRHLDSPNFVPYGRVNNKFQCSQGWVLACKLAFGNRGGCPPDVSLDQAAQAYADYWFPPSLRGLEEFKDVKYVEYHYHACDYPTGFIWTKAKECAGEKVRVSSSARAEWLRKEEQNGACISYTSPPLPSVLYEDEDSSGSESETDSIIESAAEGSTQKPWVSPRREHRRRSSQPRIPALNYALDLFPFMGSIRPATSH